MLTWTRELERPGEVYRLAERVLSAPPTPAVLALREAFAREELPPKPNGSALRERRLALARLVVALEDEASEGSRS